MFVSVKNPCLPNPCKNGGKCNRKGSSYTCSCAKGYTGKRCEGTFNLNRMLVQIYIYGNDDITIACDKVCQ